MSATPIPRTLQMSLAGMRDISVIETPPEGRRPVKTYVGEYDEELVKRGDRAREERGGQAFFLHNRVESIERRRAPARLCPGCASRSRHGQMDEHELEERMLASCAATPTCWSRRRSSSRASTSRRPTR
jgi:transcription-repair coupling factor (superfamily II helicase)